MCHGDARCVGVIKKALEEFSGCSGLVPNQSKSTTYFGSLTVDDKDAINQVLLFATGSCRLDMLEYH